jgi:pyridinium-3,5-biscarboxylic acid mononucleotide synthase
MDTRHIERVLIRHKAGDLSLADAMEELRNFPVQDLSYALLDTHREMRTGIPEVIFCAGKSAEQVRGIIAHLVEGKATVLATHATEAHFAAARELSPLLRYDPVSRTISLPRDEGGQRPSTSIAVVTAGTSDMPVAEEAAVTAEILGNPVQRIYDVGVAGLHRVLAALDRIRASRVVIVVAGMEGALASVIGGLIRAPVIAVPTSVGYGASFHGLSALLGMLNCCAPGVSVVNIDNGFGAACMASRINMM